LQTAMSEEAETVILIHGLWMRGVVLLPQQRWLRTAGFAVRRFSYPSWRDGLADNVRLLAGCIAATPGAVIHLVAHSLGGLVALQMLSQRVDTRIRRVVLLGTPYAGCHCGFALAATPLRAALLGRTFWDWFGQPRPTLPTVEIGVIAGTRRISGGRLIRGLARPNDGLIAVAETQVAAATDSITLPVSHSGLLVSRACAAQVADFLRTGSFSHA
jgi:pimeloyl-ACP methyl ester carboxylesterase